MGQLSSCYFCGAALDASLDEYPVVPRNLHPDPDQQRSVVLCQGCRRKLGNVVERVVDVATAQDGRAAAGETDEWDELVGGGEHGETPDDGAAIDAGEVSGTPAQSGASDDPLADTTSSDDSDEQTDGSPAGESGDGAGTTAADDTSTDEQSDDATSMSALEYNKVMRLLQNRELPVDRAEFRTVATNAYDISGSEFDTIVDAAVDRGLIGEADGQFVSAE